MTGPVFRYNPFDDRVVIIAGKRSGRPINFHGKSPFAPENETLTPPTTLALPNRDEWLVRCFNNAFPATQRKGKYQPLKETLAWTSPAFGDHEVIVETPSQDEQLEDLPLERLMLCFEAYENRTASLYGRGAKYVSLFKNHGPKAGASIGHEHSQIISLPFVPADARRRMALHAKGSYRKALAGESRNRLFSNRHFEVFRPSFAVHPFELWLVPKRQGINSLSELTREEAESFMTTLSESIRRVKNVCQEYNVLYHQAPPGEKMLFHCQIIPRSSVWAGFEYESGVIINSKNAADAVAALK